VKQLRARLIQSLADGVIMWLLRFIGGRALAVPDNNPAAARQVYDFHLRETVALS
jgi:hypothetical protein